MKIWRSWFIALLVAGVALSALPLTGLLPHHTRVFGPIDWYNSLAQRQSVGLRAITISVPDLEEPERAMRAAGLYEIVCATCHGSPVSPPEAFAEELSPTPPLLTLGAWRSPQYEFQVIAYGLRGTAMPAWPASGRMDEIWDMVAFLKLLPMLSEEEYRNMAGEGRCRDCHGERGEGRNGIPRLDIHAPAYIAASLRAYREGTRSSGVMMAVARTLSDTQISSYAKAYGTSETLSRPASAEMNPLATQGDAARDIPACLSCHGNRARPDYPRLIGQEEYWLALQLQLFRQMGSERGGDHAKVMAPIADKLTEEEVEQLAAWLAGRKP